MRVVEERVAGYRTCSRPQEELPRDCEGYDSQPCEVLHIVTTRTFGDLDPRAHGATPDLSDLMSDTLERILPVAHEDPQAWLCEFCDGPATFSLEPRGEYPRRSPTPPTELTRRARGDTERADQGLALQQRQTAALEHANLLKERELAALEAHNGHQSPSEPEDDPSPTPRRPRTGTRSP